MDSNERNKLVIFFVLIALATAGVIIFAWQFIGANQQLTGDVENDIKPVEEVSPQQLKEMYDSGEEFVLLDVRTPEEYTEAHIEGALNIKYSELESRYITLPEGKPVITMCNGSNCKRSTYAAGKLIELGFQDVKNFKSGTAGWQEAGYELVKGPPPPDPIVLTEVTPEELYSKISEGNGIFLIDVRGKNEFDSGHIEGAQLIEFGDITKSFKNGDIPTDKEIIIYDSTGIRGRVAAETLLGLGVLNTKALENGIKNWVSSGFALER